MSATESIEKLTQDINQMLFQVGQLYVQNEINKLSIADITSRATTLAKKVETIKSNTPKGVKDEHQTEVIESSTSNDEQREVGAA